MSTPITTDTISHFRELLGSAVLLPWPAGSKGDRRKWKHLQVTDMDEDYFAKLEKAGNIGVALGAVSNGLVTIDIDDDNLLEPFLEANPLLRHTLRTAAQRGCNIWVRCTTDYPSSCKLKDQSGNEVGEWRADGNQTIIAGTHPSGCSYRLVVEKPVIPIDYNVIIWSDTILPPHATENKRVEGVRRVKREQRVGEDKVVCVGVCEQIQPYFTPDLISHIAPKAEHQNNRSLFNLARLVRSAEHSVGRPATQAELEFVFDRWCLVARPFWRPGLTRDDYYAEFLEAYSYARIGLDENPIEVAVSRARSAPLPQVRGFSDERIRLLAAICREMQLLTGSNPFFLPTRKLGEVLGAHWTEVGRWLRILEKPLQVIHLAPGEVRKRGGNRSPRYYYGPPLQVSGPSTRPSLPQSHVPSSRLALPAHAGV